MIRSGSREQRKKMLPGGSGSGDLDDATEALQGLPTVLYADPTTTATATTTAAATTAAATGTACYQKLTSHPHAHTHLGVITV